MVTVRATCHECGDVEMTIAAVTCCFATLQYSFDCPACGRTTVRGTSYRTTIMLAQGGAVDGCLRPRLEP